ncbi:methyl-accepting chemotaxis protein, partial [Paraburkholderia sp. SIMBA_061]
FTQFGDATGRASMDSIDGRQTLFRSVGLVILALLLAGTAGVYVALRRGVVGPLEEAGRHFERIAQGRLNQPIEARGTNEI